MRGLLVYGAAGLAAAELVALIFAPWLSSLRGLLEPGPDLPQNDVLGLIAVMSDFAYVPKAQSRGASRSGRELRGRIALLLAPRSLRSTYNFGPIL